MMDRTGRPIESDQILGRRRFLGAMVTVSSMIVSSVFAPVVIAAPKETGLSFEGLLKNQLGFQPRRPAPLPHEAIPGFLSRAQIAANYSSYRAAFNELITAEKALASASRDARHSEQYAALRKQQLEAGNSVLLHEFYFRNLAVTPVAPSGYVTANMNEHMGSIEDWRADFIATARVAAEWAVLAYDPYDDRWHNVPLGVSSAGGWVGANPLVVCDVAEHAWSVDYQKREDYLTKFFDHLDWSVVDRRYRGVDRQ